MHKKASLVLGIAIMALAAWAIHGAWDWPLKAKLFPLAIGVPLFLLAAAEVLWAIKGSAARGDIPDFQLSTALPRSVMLRRTLVAMAWIVGFFIAILLAGFLVAVPVFVLVFLRFQGRESWTLCLVFTAVLWAVFYGLFERTLHLPFPQGWIQGWLGLG
jgi:hypothetical protein